MPFKFSLDTVLRVRVILEEQEERMLQRILFEVTQTREAIARIDAELAGTTALRLADVNKQDIGHNIQASYGYVQQLKQSRKEQEDRLEKLMQLREKQVAIYETARRNREMITDLREEKRSAYEAELARGEQKTVDDNFNARRGRI
jgi:flagellar FliJ protein